MKKAITFLLIISTLSASAQTDSHERDSVAQTTAFRTKVKMASHIAANQLLADAGQPATVLKYAQVIISEPDGSGWLAALSYGCMTNQAINYNSSDGDIQFTINSIFAKYANAYYKVLP